MSARPPRSAAALLAAFAILLFCPPLAEGSKHRDRVDNLKVTGFRPSDKHSERVTRASRVVKRKRSRSGEGAGAGEAVRRTHPLFGVFTDGAPYGGDVDAIDTLESSLSRRIDIVNWYQQWDPGAWIESFRPEIVQPVIDSGRIPLLTWEPWQPGPADQPRFRLRRIAEGEFDAYITTWAEGLAEFGHEVYLRPMHEMNGNWYPWGASIGDNTPKLYIRAWRRMVDIFRRNGAHNVKWVWCPIPYSIPHTKDNEMEDYYPGRSYVDVLSVDGYNWGDLRPEYGGWTTFEEIFRQPYKDLAKLGPQPIWIAEVGSAPEGGDKAQWVRDMWKSARTMPRLEAIVWFDQNKEEDWSVMPVASAFAKR